MVNTDEEITRRLEERDSARRARRAQTASTVGELARRHTELAEQLADLERELGEVLTAAGDVIDVSELADVTDVPVADLTRWRDQVAKPARGGKRKRPGTAKNNGTPGKDTPAATAPPAAPTPAAPESAGNGGVAVGAASS
ncbi:hypothetical protein NQK81_27765 [Amycolatopsis roodepoortensis]|uniref:hypothetical protein n=1 Tax=Amycolatopsis roodepoortensis TaxID=700274 RepID=UPI00214C7460|nr:hypothetical protein [Amycolatopsis roodepoortensis]UUV28574.1 hypothetical protein NQK81_27765 [Amycolatopsis roodepoortensis]